MKKNEYLEILNLVKSTKTKRTEIYYKNEKAINRLNKLIELKEKVDTVMKEYNIPVSTNREFKNVEEHLNYLSKNGLYIIKQLGNCYMVEDGKQKMKGKKTILNMGKNDYFLYHGTSILNAKNILKKGVFKAEKDNTDIIQYNKVFFSSTIEYAKVYGLVGGISYNYNIPDNTDKYIVFGCNPKQYNVYGYINRKEYIIWGDVSSDIIKKIYLYEADKEIKELSKEELLNL